MGLSVRDWMVIVGVLLVVAVLLDGYRRMRQEWRSQIRTSLSKAGSDKDGGDVNSELPNGGARVVTRSERRASRVEPRMSYATDPLHGHTARSKRRENNPSRRDTAAASDAEPADDVAYRTHPARHDSEPGVAIDIDDTAPVIGDADAMDDGFARLEPGPAEYDDDRAPYLEHEPYDDEHEPYDDEPEPYDDLTEPVAPVFDAPEPLYSTDDRSASSASLSSEASEEWAPNDPTSTFESPDEAPALGPADEVVVINVLAKDQPFAGPELLQILLTCDLRFGKMNIFHRYEQAGGKGPLQFSVANIVEPGVFNLDRIDEFTTRGVCFFLTLPGPQEPLVAFNYMVETAQCLVRNLNGELRDEAHSAMTAQTLEHCRARIREFERRQLTRPPR